MNSHLSPEEISQWILGDRTAERAQHMRECTACSLEVERLESALQEFRSAVHGWSALLPAPASPRRTTPRRVVRWALAAAALVAIALVPVYRHRQAEAETARADAILLEQVDAEVSQAVPSPMEPLVQLVSWSSSSEGNGETQ
jgi:hypothetical protein